MTLALSTRVASLRAARCVFGAVGCVLMLAVSGCAPFGCSRDRKPEPAPVQWMTAKDGLSGEHQGATPMLERTSCPPRASCLTSRVYRDGTLYYLKEASDAGPARWNRIAQLTTAGVQSLEKLYASLCGKEDPVLGNDVGSDRHRVSVPGCTHEFVVTGIPSGELAPIQQATELINSSVIPGSGAPAQ